MKIGIINDLTAFADLLRRAIALRPEHRVIWMAESGADGVALCAKERPDLILMNVLMPGMDGVETTRRIMASTPCAILVVTASVRANAGRVFEAMGHGALDAVDTPLLDRGSSLSESTAPLLAKIATISRLIAAKATVAGPPNAGGRGSPRDHPLVAIGASAGGPAVLAEVLRGLPHDFSAAIVIVQHVDERFAAGMAEWLGQATALPVRVAREGDRPVAGGVLLAGTGDHLVLKTSDRLAYTADPTDYVYRPSVDVFFHSACRLWRGDVVGVLLTGMGRDGALGLKALRTQGHYTIAQDEATSAVYGMPKAAAMLKAAVDILPANRIAPKLMELVTCKS